MVSEAKPGRCVICGGVLGFSNDDALFIFPGGWLIDPGPESIHTSALLCLLNAEPQPARGLATLVFHLAIGTAVTVSAPVETHAG